MNTVQADPDGVEETVNLVFFETIEGSAAFTLVPALAGPVVLDGATDIQFNIRFGSGLLANVGTVSTELTQGSTVIASAAGELAPTANSYGDVKLTAKAEVTTLDPAGGDLVWTITFEGAGSAYLQVGQSEQWCNLVLPILSAPTGSSGNATNVTGNATGNATGNGTGNATGNAPGNPTDRASSTSTSPSATDSTVAPAGEGNATKVDDEAAKVPAPALAPLALGMMAVAGWLRRRRPPETAISPPA